MIPVDIELFSISIMRLLLSLYKFSELGYSIKEFIVYIIKIDYK